MRFLIDECLNTSLVEVANRAGHEAYHVNFLGRSASQDFELQKLILQEEYTFVTNNARDFQRLIAATDLHPGLVIIVPCVTSEIQRALFQRFLDRLGPMTSLINRVVEVDLNAIRIYERPKLK